MTFLDAQAVLIIYREKRIETFKI